MRRVTQLRTRFLMAGLLFVITTVASGLWSAYTFARMSSEVSETLEQSQKKIDVTAILSQELEREDDALLLILSGNLDRARTDLASQRVVFDRSYQRLAELITTEEERVAAGSLRRNADEYREAGDNLFNVPASDRLSAYHADVNPILRLAVADAALLRELTFRSMQAVGIEAGAQARQAFGVVMLVSLVALVVSTVTALQLTRSVVGPIATLTESVEGIRRGEFDKRVQVATSDELGTLASGFNNMASALDEFRRSNLGETLRAKETLESTLAALPNAVIVVDPAGQIATLNAVARAVLDAKSSGGITSMNELPFMPDHLTQIRDALEGKRSSANRADYSRSVLVHLDGRMIRLLPTAVPIPQSSGNRYGAVLVLEDVTDFVRLDELRTELIALVSHELRTPLTSLRMNMLMLREQAHVMQERQRDLLDAALAGCEDLGRTIDELLDLSRIESGQLRLSKMPVDLKALVDQLVAGFRPRFAAAGVDLQCVAECQKAIVLADRSRLTVVISNLLTNALKYTPLGGSVEARVSTQNAGFNGAQNLQIAVSDTGPGVPMEFQEQIFEKFFRVEHQTSKSGVSAQGTGFGLYLCRQIVEAHGGRIRCISREDGPGTTIRFEIPSERLSVRSAD
jgi:two-component system, NtrC family, sensor histidine kinase KinB